MRLFSPHMPKINIKRVLFFSLIASIALTSCPPQVTIKLIDVSSSSPPIVGKYVEMQLEVESIGDEQNAIVALSLPPMIYSPDQEHRWKLSLKEGAPVTLSTEICVLEEGAWAVDVSLVTLWDDGVYKFGGRKTIGVISTASYGEVLLEREIDYQEFQQIQDSPGPRLSVDPSDCTYEMESTVSDDIESGTLAIIIGLSLLLIISAGYLVRRVFRGKQDEL
jgi:hypothetical protein